MTEPDAEPREGRVEALGQLVNDYVHWAQNRRYAASTVRARRGYLRHLVAWMAQHGATAHTDIDGARLEAYRSDICKRPGGHGRTISVGAVTQRLLAVRGFLAWCARATSWSCDWGDALALPQRPLNLPKRVLSAVEVETLLAQPDTSTILGMRDRTILELFYATAIRRAELTGLMLDDVDRSRQTLWVRHGKGDRDRLVPLGERALDWIGRYERDARPSLLPHGAVPWLFPTRRGNRWQPKHLGERISRYMRRAGLGARGSCHAIRHAVATLMYERGADIRTLQAMLGHARLSTTQLYTHVGIAHLVDVHARTHPAMVIREGLR